MNILEQDLESLICNAIENREHELLSDRGLPIHEEYTYSRQPDLGSYGRADLIGVNVSPSTPKFLGKGVSRDVHFQIFELKKDEINLKAFLQAVRYAKAIKHRLKHEGVNYNVTFDLILVGKTLDTECDFVYLPDLWGRVEFYTYELSLTQGLTFTNRHGFKLTQPSFKEGSTAFRELLLHNVKYNKQREMEEYWEQYEAWQSASGRPASNTDDLPF